MGTDVKGERIMIKLQEKETAQETFDYIVTKLREQGVPSINPDGFCIYGEPGGVRCAIGHLMGDQSPDSIRNLYGLVETDGLVEKPKQYELLQELQRNHDYPVGYGSAWPRKCAARLMATAGQFDLDPRLAKEWLLASGGKTNEPHSEAR